MPLLLQRVSNELTIDDKDLDNSWRAGVGRESEVDMSYHNVEDDVIVGRRVSTVLYVEYTHAEWEESSSIQVGDVLWRAMNQEKLEVSGRELDAKERSHEM